MPGIVMGGVSSGWPGEKPEAGRTAMPGYRAHVAKTVAGPALFWLAGATVFFRAYVFSDFDLIFGDGGDSQILIAVLEHWSRFWSGASGFKEALFFYPEPDALGFTDTYFLFGLPYALFRRFLVDGYAAYVLTLVVLSAIGFAGYQLLLARTLGVRWWIAATAALIAIFGNAMQLRMMHGQAFALMFLPWVLLAAIAALEASRPPRMALWAGASGLLLGLVFLSAFATAWFFSILVIVACLCLWATQDGRELVAANRTIAVPFLTGGVAGFAIGIIPFALVYGPVILQDRARTFAEVSHYAPVWSDLLNVGSGNMVWGWLLGGLRKAAETQGERRMGYTPGLLALALTSLWWLSKASAARFCGQHDRAILLKSLGWSVAIVTLAMLGYGGLRPWYLVWASVPGADAIRTLFRAQIVFIPVMAAIAAFAAEHLLRSAPPPGTFAGLARHSRALSLALAGFLLAEQVNLESISALSRREMLGRLSRMPAPPPVCRVFYVAGNRAEDRPWYHLQAEAMMLAELTGVPTVNGNSSWWPDGWKMMDPAAPGYPEQVRSWLVRHGLSGEACAADIEAGAWATRDLAERPHVRPFRGFLGSFRPASDRGCPTCSASPCPKPGSA